MSSTKASSTNVKEEPDGSTVVALPLSSDVLHEALQQSSGDSVTPLVEAAATAVKVENDPKGEATAATSSTTAANAAAEDENAVRYHW